MKKDWDRIMREIPTPPDSDEEDSLNVVSVQKKAKRVTELIHSAIPGMDPRFAGAPAKGMNTTSLLFDKCQETFKRLGPQNGTGEGPTLEAIPFSEEERGEGHEESEPVQPPVKAEKSEESPSSRQTLPS